MYKNQKGERTAFPLTGGILLFFATIYCKISYKNIDICFAIIYNYKAVDFNLAVVIPRCGSVW